MKVSFKNKIEDLKISTQAKETLNLKGIFELEDCNLYNLSNYRMFFADETLSNDVKKEIIDLLRKHKYPQTLNNLSLGEEAIEHLKESGIYDTSDLLSANRANLYRILKKDEYFLNDVNKVFEFFLIDELSDKDYDEQYEIISSQENAEDIDLEQRINLKVKTNKKGYGSRVYSHLKIRIASPEEIRMWSFGEVKNHETINYRTSKPEEGGLFCEKIFGPTKDFQCLCGKKQNGNKGQICPKCGIEITESLVRRERKGHIELSAPIVHTWYLKNAPSRLAILLGIKSKSLEEVINYSAYIVTDPGSAPLKKKQILTEQDYFGLSEKFVNRFEAVTGAEAVRTLLRELDLEKESKKLRNKFKVSTKQKREKLIKRLEVVEAFNNSDSLPEWVVMDVIPVIPPELRPMVPLDGGRFATTDLNDLYRKILNRNNRYKREMEHICPTLVLKNEKRLIQEAVDALFDNSKRGKKAIMGSGRPLKSLSDLLRGKQGRFRQNLLGKRVDYSGRSVIIIGPDLKMYQAGIPREMAITLFKPFVIRELQLRFNLVDNKDRRKAVIMYDKQGPEVWEALEKVVEEHPILLNRAPTLHRLGIQAFEPKLIDGKAIRIHPLVTTAFNADFDGDQMAIHLPLSPEAQAEARLLMLASTNILNPKDGKPVVTPTQDIVLGNYYLTIEEHYDPNKADSEKNKREGMFFANVNEVLLAYENKLIDYHTRIVIKPDSLNKKFKKEQLDKYLVTTYGKIIFNQIFPSDFPYINEPTDKNITKNIDDRFFISKGENPKDYFEKNTEKIKPFNKKFLGKIIEEIFKRYKVTKTSIILDKLKDAGFKFSTIAGITVAFSDINPYSKKQEVIDKTNKKIDQITEFYEEGMTTDSERSKLVIKEWELATKEISQGLIKELKATEDNHLNIISDSGARGSDQNFAQLAGIRGILNNPKGEKIEVPVKASFREGLTVSEFFISTHAARKGSTDTALKTAESGYLTRRLVDVAQDVIIVSEDCGTENGFLMKDILDKDGKTIVSLYDRIVGRFSAYDVVNKYGDVLVLRNDLINEKAAKNIVDSEIKSITIRSNLTCVEPHGICAKCYGRNLATNEKVEVGEAVGVIAAQSIGEPGTQLTMRTFHTGGVASASDITQGLPRIQELFEARNPKGKAIITEVAGKIKQLEQNRYKQIITILTDQKEEVVYEIDPTLDLCVKKGQHVQAGDKLTLGSINPKELLRVLGVIAAQEYILGEVQKVYRSQNVEISDKHIEIIIRQMLKRIIVIFEGDTQLLPGIEISKNDFIKSNKEAFAEGVRPAVGKPILLGITRASLRSDSFLSAASFQETTRILTDAAIRGKIDELHGLKENVIIGGLIPAGTGILRDEEYEYERSKLENTPEYEEFFKKY